MNYSLIFQNKKKHGKNRLLLNYTSKFYYSSQETLCYGNYIYTIYETTTQLKAVFGFNN